MLLFAKSVQEVRIEELEAQLESGKADLKSAQKRIDTLHSALKGHEEDFSGDDTREFDDTYGDVTGDDLSSSGSSYKIGEYDDDLDEDLSGLSDVEGSGIQLDVPSTSTRTQTWERSTRSRSRELPPIIDDGELSSSYDSQHRNRSRSRDKHKDNTEEDTAVSSQQKDVDIDDDASSSRQRKQKDLEDEEMPKRMRRKSATEGSATKRSERYKLNVDGELSSSSRGRSGSKNSLDDRETFKTSSKAKDLNDDDDSDADLEELLKKQRERVKSIRDDEEEHRAISSVRRPSTGSGARPSDEDSLKGVGKIDASPLTSPSHEAKVNGTSKRGSDSREASQEPSEEPSTPSKKKKNRRRQQRQRTIELLTSPKHQVIKSNGVK